MAQISTSVRSASLGFVTHLQVIIPFNPEKPEAPVDKVLYLLHGLSDDCTAWCRQTRVYHYAVKHNYMVVMPEVQRSFYSDMAHGSKYLTYVTKELPQIIEKLFNFRHTKGNTFVAGLSMGGYGAAKCALTRPDFYAACGSFSGAMDMRARTEASKDMVPPPFPELKAILGESLVYPDNADLFFLADRVAKLEEKPRMFITCGDADFLLDDNRRFDAHLKALDYGHTYMEWPGEHVWPFWEECLPLAFDFFENNVV
ncbi:MAG: esterase family protein [Defluviitaleaceae bacterium]|nr:esterase family protein [Defluviitaleaceae bacterium]